VYAALGSKVTVVEMTTGLLPGVDRDLVGPLKKRLETLFDAMHLDTKVVSVTAEENGIVAAFDGENVEQSFGRNAAAVQADAARFRLIVDQRDVHPAIRCVKRCRISTRSAAKNHEFDPFAFRLCHA